MAQEYTGGLQIKAQTARGARPVPGAQVYISSTDQNGESTGVIAAGRTDTSGLSEIFILSTPPEKNSEQPNTPPVSTKYHVEVMADGYYPSESFDVPIFPGILSVQNAMLVPLLGKKEV